MEIIDGKTIQFKQQKINSLRLGLRVRKTEMEEFLLSLKID